MQEPIRNGESRWRAGGSVEEAVETGSRAHSEEVANPARALELSHIIDVQAVQALMDDFHELTGLPMSLVDLEDRVLVGVGWQDVCTRFHRVHPETAANCRESDLVLTQGVPYGEFRAYKCKNGMWDIVTPVFVSDVHVGNVFAGQFFYDDEEPDMAASRRQAEMYGFDRDEYMRAVLDVPDALSGHRRHANAFLRTAGRADSAGGLLQRRSCAVHWGSAGRLRPHCATASASSASSRTTPTTGSSGPTRTFGSSTARHRASVLPDTTPLSSSRTARSWRGLSTRMIGLHGRRTLWTATGALTFRIIRAGRNGAMDRAPLSGGLRRGWVFARQAGLQSRHHRAQAG